LQTLAHIKELLASYGLSPKKSLGQNFLCDHNLIRKLVDRADVTEGELVLEIGPGTGALTDELIERGAEIIACEMDDGLAAINRERLGDRITLIHGDCLRSKREINPEIIEAIGGRPFKLIANLPYGAASPLMMTLACEHANCEGMWVTIQKELAERFRATNNTKVYGEVTVIAPGGERELVERHTLAAQRTRIESRLPASWLTPGEYRVLVRNPNEASREFRFSIHATLPSAKR